MKGFKAYRTWGLMIASILLMFVLLLNSLIPVMALPLLQRAVSVYPDTGPPGTRVEVSGSGWTHNSQNPPYELHWDNKGGPVLGTFTTDSNGNFTETITIPRDIVVIGERKIWVCEGCGSGSPQTEFWVVVSFNVTPWPTPIAIPTSTPIPTACDVTGGPGEIVIDFEGIDPDERLRGFILPEGVIFTYENPMVIASSRAHSGSRALENYPFGGGEFGSAGAPLEIEVLNIQDFVGVFVGINQDEGNTFTATLTAWGEDEAGNPIIVGTYSDALGPNAGPIETCLWVEAPGQILRATVNYGPGVSVGAPEFIDDLVFRGPETPVPVPEDDLPPIVEINNPSEGDLILSGNVGLEGEVVENRGLERVEVWINDAYYKDIGAARMGVDQYWFLDYLEGEKLRICDDNVVEVRAYDTGGNEGSDQATFHYLGPGDLEIASIDPVQALYGAPLVVGKGTAFRVMVNSTFHCPIETEFRLELPEAQWSTGPPSTGRWHTGMPPDWEYPEIWGPVTIPGTATDYKVMLPYLPGGEESKGFGGTTHPAGMIRSREAGGVIGPSVRVVPRPVTGPAEFAVEIDPNDEVTETDEANNRMASSPHIVVTTKGLSLYFVPFVLNLYPSPEESISAYEYYLRERGYSDSISRLQAVQAAESNGSVTLSLALSAEDIDRLGREMTRYTEYMVGAYPFADSKVYSRLGETLYFQEEYLIAKDHNPCHNGPFMADMHDLVDRNYPDVDVVILFNIYGCCGQSPGVYVDAGLELGAGHPYWHHEMINTDLTPDDEKYYCWNWDLTFGQAAEYVIGHELCHFLLGMRGECYACGDPDHEYTDCAYCDTDVDGFWVNRWQEIPQGTPYFMHGVCGGCLYWNRLEPSRQKNGMDNPDGYLNAIDVFSSASDPQALLVRGQITKDGEVILKPFHILQDATLDLREGATGDYYIVLVDAKGDEMNRWGFEVIFYSFGPPPKLPEEIDVVYFSYKVEWQEGVRRVELQDSNGHVLASRDISANAPEVRVIYPNGGEVWGEGKTYTIRWEAADQDGDDLTYSLAVSKDVGETWIPVDLDLTSTEYELRTAGMVSSDSYIVKVMVTDGVNSGEDTSDSIFTVQAEGGAPMSPIVLVGIVVLGVGGIGMIVAALVLARRRAAS